MVVKCVLSTYSDHKTFMQKARMKSIAQMSDWSAEQVDKEIKECSSEDSTGVVVRLWERILKAPDARIALRHLRLWAKAVLDVKKLPRFIDTFDEWINVAYSLKRVTVLSTISNLYCFIE